MQSFHGKNYWALILGGSSGMGLAAAHKLAAAGMHLFILHRDLRRHAAVFETEKETMRRHGVSVHSANVNALDEQAIAATCETLRQALGENGRVRLLLHSIARGNLKKLVADNEPVLTEEDFRLTLHAMGTSLWQWTNAVLQAQLFAEDARVIGLTSEGSGRAWPGYAAVGAAKAVLENLARSMAVELAPKGIRTNIIQPGATDTPAFRQIPGHEKIREMAIEKNPFRRLTTPQDVANVIGLLCTDEASWINGALLHADGGEHCA